MTVPSQTLSLHLSPKRTESDLGEPLQHSTELTSLSPSSIRARAGSVILAFLEMRKERHRILSMSEIKTEPRLVEFQTKAQNLYANLLPKTLSTEIDFELSFLLCV